MGDISGAWVRGPQLRGYSVFGIPGFCGPGLVDLWLVGLCVHFFVVLLGWGLDSAISSGGL